jgi:hypothetical protein
VSIHIQIPWLGFEIILAIQKMDKDEDEELGQEPAFRIGFG